MEEEDMRDLKATVGNKANRKLERTCEGSGWITDLPRYQDETDISREEFREALKWRPDIYLQPPPSTKWMP